MTAGHTPLIPKWHIKDYFSLTQVEVNAINTLMAGQKKLLELIDPTIDGVSGDVTCEGVGAIVLTILSAFATFELERIAARIREVK